MEDGSASSMTAQPFCSKFGAAAARRRWRVVEEEEVDGADAPTTLPSVRATSPTAHCDLENLRPLTSHQLCLDYRGFGVG